MVIGWAALGPSLVPVTVRQEGTFAAAVSQEPRREKAAVRTACLVSALVTASRGNKGGAPAWRSLNFSARQRVCSLPIPQPAVARCPRCGNHRLESRVRENRQHGSEGGEAKAFPTPIGEVRLSVHG